MKIWLRKHPREARWLSLIFMLVAAAALYPAALANYSPGIWLFLGIFVLGNLVALFTS
jgi:hypothetical protein